MELVIRAYEQRDLPDMIRIWNEVVEDGQAFPQEEGLDETSAPVFFAAQTYTAVAADSRGQVMGLYILHPNNIGRCGHISNASFAVRRQVRGLHIGEHLVRDCLDQAKRHGFRLLQFNAVVATNVHAVHLYERLGFLRLGTIPQGFRAKTGEYRDIFVYYHTL